MLKQTQKIKLTQLQEDKILLEDIILRTMSSAVKYVYGNSKEYKKWDELNSGKVKGVYDLRKEFLKKLRYAISGYNDDFKKDHPKENIDYNIVKKNKLITDLENLINIIKTDPDCQEFVSDIVYYQKFIDLINGKKVTNLTEMDIYKYGKTTKPSNLNENYMGNMGHEIMKMNEMAQRSEKKLFEEAERNMKEMREMIIE